MSVISRAFYLLLSFLSLSAGLFLASSHPVAPVAVSVAFIGTLLLLVWHPRLAIFLVPALLPLLNFSPWTGWSIADEFDLLILAVLAAGYFRMQLDGFNVAYIGTFLFLLTIVVLLIARGANDLNFGELSLYSAYTTPLNGFRVGKSLLWTALLLPLVAKSSNLLSVGKSGSYFFASCLIGSCGVVLAVLWERAFYPGLLDISTPYRTVALFWEMHLGGAALDAYLVLIAPLLIWAWRAVTSIQGRSAVGTFIVVFTYVALTTFSRGVIGAIAGSVILLGALLALRRIKGAQVTTVIRLSSVIVLLFVVVEVVLVLGTDSFINKRLAVSERDFGGRLRHWEQGIGLLKTPGEWLFGIGLGQLPTRMTKDEAGPALPGAFYWHEDVAGHPSMVIEGADGLYDGHELGRFFALSQRVDLVPKQRYRLSLEMRSDDDVALLVQVCAEHLLYPARCQYRKIKLSSGGGGIRKCGEYPVHGELVEPLRPASPSPSTGSGRTDVEGCPTLSNAPSGGWQHWESVLLGYPFRFGSWQGIGHGVFLLSVLTPGVKVEVAKLVLTAGDGNLLRNSQFEDKEAGWFPSAHSYFLPWHIDNLYLEVLIEAGIVGLFCFLAGVFWIVWRLFRAFEQGNEQAPYFIASIAGLLALGLVVSVFDMPRVATLFGLLLAWAWQSSRNETDQ